MICARCNKPIEPDQLYQQAQRRSIMPDMHRYQDPTVDVHLDCPKDMPVAPEVLLDIICCANCRHPASKHQMAIEDGAIVILDGYMYCEHCTCTGFRS